MATHRIHKGDFPDPDCLRCQEMTVGDLDDGHFSDLMGMNRREFEAWCDKEFLRWQWGEGWGDVGNMPHGLYVFWYSIMNTKVLTAYARKAELEERMWAPSKR